MAVLILTGELDSTADHVVKALVERGVEVHRINTAWFPTQLRVNAELSEGCWCGELRSSHRVIDLGAIDAVWYRAPEAYQFPAALTVAERHHATMEAKYGLGGVLASLPALWVKHPARIADIAYKPIQLTTAAACGLTVPDTVITNEPSGVSKFADGRRIITKMIGASTIVENCTRKLARTHLVQDADLIDLRGVEHTTHLFQEWVPKAYEVRLVAIGGAITSAAIHASTAESYIDYRADYDGNSYRLIDTPEDVTAGVRMFMKIRDLRYGVFDFVVTPNDDWVFLEINASGQYGFVERHTGAPLTAQLADLLAGGNHS